MNTISNKQLVQTLLKFLENDKKKFIFWNIPIIISHFLDLSEPIIIGYIINFFASYSPNSEMNKFYQLILLLLAATILQAIFRNFSRGAFFDIQANLEYNIKVRGWENISNNTLAWNSSESSGNKIQRLETGKDSLVELLHFIREDFYYIIINIVSIVIIFISTNYIYAIFFSVYTLLYFLFTKYWDRNNPKHLERINKAKESSSGKTFEATNNILSIKSLGAIEEVQNSLNKIHTEYKEAFKAWQRLGIYKWTSISVLDLIFLIGFLFLMGYSLQTNIINVGLVFILYSYFSRLQDIIGSLSKKYTQTIEIKSNIARLIPLFEVNNKYFGTNKFPNKWNSINIINGHFEYSSKDNKVILNNINFSLLKNDFIGIIGTSGTGKSTLLKLLVGLYKLNSGSISINESNYYDLSLGSLLKQIAIILQETELFNDTLLQNITMYKTVNLKKLSIAIYTSCLKDVIDELPEGLNTIIGEKGAKLSGGQRQRIGIARAIYKGSQILLMDEATSNLDVNTENTVINNILELTPKKTIIAVAHRISTIEKANKVFEIKNGSIIQTKGKENNK